MKSCFIIILQLLLLRNFDNSSGLMGFVLFKSSKPDLNSKNGTLKNGLI